jgi:hypothetical protein
MITIKGIQDENGTYLPSEVIDSKFGSLFNGTDFIYFESDEERIEYLKTLDTEN